MIDCSPDAIAARITKFARRCEIAQAAGGVSRAEVEDNLKVIPEGWVLDFLTDYYLPPNFIWPTTEVIQ